jgi:hypothetical protein
MEGSEVIGEVIKKGLLDSPLLPLSPFASQLP